MNEHFQLKFCQIHRKRNLTHVTFPDGRVSTNWLPLQAPDFEHFKQIAASCGFDEASLGDYVLEHEFAHGFLAEKMFDIPSPTQERAASGRPASPATLFEERFVWHWQRFAHKRALPLELEWLSWKEDWDRLIENR